MTALFKKGVFRNMVLFLTVISMLSGSVTIRALAQDEELIGNVSAEQAFTFEKKQEDIDSGTAVYEMRILSEGLSDMVITLPEGLSLDGYTYEPPQEIGEQALPEPEAQQAENEIQEEAPEEENPEVQEAEVTEEQEVNTWSQEEAAENQGSSWEEGTARDAISAFFDLLRPMKVYAAGNEAAYNSSYNTISIDDASLVTQAVFSFTFSGISSASGQIVIEARLNGSPIETIESISSIIQTYEEEQPQSTFNTWWSKGNEYIGENVQDAVKNTVYTLHVDLVLSGEEKKVITITHPYADSIRISGTPLYGETMPTFKNTNGTLTFDYGTADVVTSFSVDFSAGLGNSHSNKIYEVSTVLKEGDIESAPSVNTITVKDYKSPEYPLQGSIVSGNIYKDVAYTIGVTFNDRKNTELGTIANMSTNSNIIYNGFKGLIDLNKFMSIKPVGQAAYRPLTDDEWSKVEILNSDYYSYDAATRILTFSSAYNYNTYVRRFNIIAKFGFDINTKIGVGYGANGQISSPTDAEFSGWAYENGFERDELKTKLLFPAFSEKTILDVPITMNVGVHAPDPGAASGTVIPNVTDECLVGIYSLNNGEIELTDIRARIEFDGNCTVTGAYVREPWVGRISFRDKDGNELLPEAIASAAPSNASATNGTVYTFTKPVTGAIYLCIDTLAAKETSRWRGVYLLGEASGNIGDTFKFNVPVNDETTANNISASYVHPSDGTMYSNVYVKSDLAVANRSCILTASGQRTAPISPNDLSRGAVIYSAANTGTVLTTVTPGQDVLLGKNVVSSKSDDSNYHENIYVTKRFWHEPVVYISLPKELTATDGNFDSYKDLGDTNVIYGADGSVYDRSNIEISVMKDAAGNDIVSIAGGQLVQIYYRGLTARPNVVLTPRLKVTVDPNILESKTISLNYKTFVGTSASLQVSDVLFAYYGTTISKERVLLGADETLPIKNSVVAVYAYGNDDAAWSFTITPQPEAAVNMSLATHGDAAIEDYKWYAANTSIGAEMYPGDRGMYKVRITNTTTSTLTNVPVYLVLPRGSAWKTEADLSRLEAVTTSNDIFNKGVKAKLYYYTGSVLSAESWTYSKAVPNGWVEYNPAAALPDITAIMFLIDSLTPSSGYEATVPFSIPAFEQEQNADAYGLAVGRTLVYFGEVFTGGGDVVKNNEKTVAIDLIKSDPPVIITSFSNMDVLYGGSVSDINSKILNYSVTDDRSSVDIDLAKSKIKFTSDSLSGLTGSVEYTLTDGISSNTLGTYEITYVSTKDADGQISSVTKTLTVTRSPSEITAPEVRADYGFTVSAPYKATMIKDKEGAQAITWTGEIAAPSISDILYVTSFNSVIDFTLHHDLLDIDTNNVKVYCDGAELYPSLATVSKNGSKLLLTFNPLDTNGNTKPDFAAIAGKALKIVITTGFTQQTANAAIDSGKVKLEALMYLNVNGKAMAESGKLASVNIVDALPPVINPDTESLFLSYDYLPYAASWEELIGFTVTDAWDSDPVYTVSGDIFPDGPSNRALYTDYNLKVSMKDKYDNESEHAYAIKFGYTDALSLMNDSPLYVEVKSRAGYDVSNRPAPNSSAAHQSRLFADDSAFSSEALKTALNPIFMFNGSPVNTDTVINLTNFGSLVFNRLTSGNPGQKALLSASVNNGRETLTSDATIIIQDTTPPNIFLKKVKGSYSITKDISVDFVKAEFIRSIIDNYDNEGDITVTFSGLEGVSFKSPGQYTVIINAADTSGNTAVERVLLDMIHDGTPVIHANSPQRYLVGSSVDSQQFLKDIEAWAEDLVDKDIAIRIQDYNNIQFTTTGTYTVTLEAENSAGKRAQPIIVTVEIYGEYANPATPTPTPTVSPGGSSDSSGGGATTPASPEPTASTPPLPSASPEPSASAPPEQTQEPGPTQPPEELDQQDISEEPEPGSDLTGDNGGGATNGQIIESGGELTTQDGGRVTVPEGITAVATGVPDVFIMLDEEGVPLGYFKPVINGSGEVEWIEVNADGTPLGSLMLNDLLKQNPKTKDTIGMSMPLAMVVTLYLSWAFVLIAGRKKRGKAN